VSSRQPPRAVPRVVPRGIPATLALAAMWAGCERPLPPGPESTLELVRRGLATGDDALVERHADGSLVADTAYLRASIEAIRYAAHGHEGHNETLTPTLFARTWEAHQRLPRAAVPALRPALAWLGGGRCAREGSGAVPDAFAPLPPADPGWPDTLRARHAEVQRRLAGAFAIRVRCAPGTRVLVTFAPSAQVGAPPSLLAIARE
jgi:hypothetical protein